MPSHLLDLSRQELDGLVAAAGEPAYRAQQIVRWALRRGATSIDEMTDLPAALRARLAATHSLTPLRELASTTARDGTTTKALLDLGGGDAVEAVRMVYDPDPEAPSDGAWQAAGRATICVSTQAGCAMRCVFCATGQQGFTRNLTASEIVGQVLHFARQGDRKRSVNVVFMGMGEPLANYAATLRAIRWLLDPDGLDLRARGITVSTVGIPSGIRRLAGEGLQTGLAISLHAPDDALRRRLVPGGASIDDLLDAARLYQRRTGRRVTFAYALLDGVNDGAAQALALARRLRGMGAHVNLIPYNPTAGTGLRRPSRARVMAFRRRLRAGGVNATVRVERGAPIAAACGQLRTDVHRRAGDGEEAAPAAQREPGDA